MSTSCKSDGRVPEKLAEELRRAEGSHAYEGKHVAAYVRDIFDDVTEPDPCGVAEAGLDEIIEAARAFQAAIRASGAETPPAPGASAGDGGDERCEECEALIPVVEGGGMANRYHGESCSLYEPNGA